MALQRFNVPNKGKNIKQAKGSQPKHDFNTLKQEKKHRKSVKVTTLNVDTDTLTKLSAAQHALGLKTHTDTLKFVIDKAIPKLIQSKVINKDKYQLAYKFLKNM